MREGRRGRAKARPLSMEGVAGAAETPPNDMAPNLKHKDIDGWSEVERFEKLEARRVFSHVREPPLEATKEGNKGNGDSFRRVVVGRRRFVSV